MARQYMKVSIRGVGGGRMSVKRPSAPRFAANRSRKISNGKRKA